MVDVTISEQERRDAEAFLVQFMTDLFPDADFSEGSVTRDHTIAALAAVAAYFRSEGRKIRAATSLRTVDALESQQDYDDAVDNIVANWFITRKSGRKARGAMTLRFSAPHSGSVPANVPFTREAGRRFLLDQTTAFSYAASDLNTLYNADGSVSAYTLRVPVVAEAPGVAYEVPAGTYSGVPTFNRYVIGAFNEAPYTGAKNVESTEDLLARVPTAISVRDLNSERSIDAVLGDLFSVIDFLTVVGYGDPAMQRDLADLPIPTRVHLGGHTDIYISTPILRSQVYEATVGGIFTDPRPSVRLFTDETIPDWRATHVVPGDVIYHQNAQQAEPQLYVIERVTAFFLEISSKQAFPGTRPTPTRDDGPYNDGAIVGATLQSAQAGFGSLDVGTYVRVSNSGLGNDGDYVILSVDGPNNTVTLDTTLANEAGVIFELLRNVVVYSIGDISPTFANKISVRTTGSFSREYREEGCVLLPPRPVYLIRDVSIRNNGDPFVDAATGRVQFSVRTNVAPEFTNDASELEYQVTNSSVQEVHSSQQFAILRVGTEPLNQGVNGSFNNANVFTAQQAIFSAPASLGRTLYIRQAIKTENIGEFQIDSVLAGNQVVVSRPSAPLAVTVAETRLIWEVTERTRFDGYPCRIEYDTLHAFDAIDAYVRNRQNRVICADTMVRGYHPVYVSVSLRYGLKRTFTGVFNELAARTAIASFLSNFPTFDDTLHVSDLVTFVQSTYPEIGHIETPITIDYSLLAPDGRVIPYRTQDAVEVDFNKLASAEPARRLTDPSSYSVVSSTLRYLSDETLIQLTRVP